MKQQQKKKARMHVRGYYTRARVFGFLMLVVAFLYAAYYFYVKFNS